MNICDGRKLVSKNKHGNQGTLTNALNNLTFKRHG